MGSKKLKSCYKGLLTEYIFQRNKEWWVVRERGDRHQT